MKNLTLAFVLFLLAVPCMAEESPFAEGLSLHLDPPETAFQEEESKTSDPEPFIQSRIYAGFWCPAYNGDEDSPGCDIGAAVSLQRWERLSWVAVAGTETIGTGLAWVAHRSEVRGQTVAVAVGVIAPYDDTGIRLDDWRPAVGATVSFWGGQR